MPQRVIYAWTVAVALLGLVVVAVLVVFGADLSRAARRGPRWKRRLVAAALALLGGLGAGGARAAAAADKADGLPAARAADAAAASSPADTPQWKRLLKTWTAADEVASGKRGPYPFNAAGKKALLADLQARANDVDALAESGRLTAPEADLLKKGLDRLARGVARKRPVELRMATCYKPMPPLTWPPYSLKRIEERLPLLARLADSKVLHAAVVAKALAGVEADLKTLAAPDALKNAKDRQRAAQTIARARALVAKVRARLLRPPAGSDAQTTARWQIVLAAWRFCKPLAESGRSTQAQRKQADEKLNAAREAIVALANAGAITPAEGGLLAAEADTVRAAIYREPPIDLQVSCYDMAYLPPASASFKRLRVRLPLLKKLAAAGKVTPAVLRSVLPTIRADLAMLGDEKMAKALAPAQKQQAAKLVADIKAAIAKLQKLAAAPAKQEVRIDLSREGGLRVDGTPVAPEKLVATLHRLGAGPDTDIILRAHDQSRWRDVVGVMQRLTDAGHKKIRLATRK